MATEFPMLGFDVDELVDDTLADTAIFDDNCMSSIAQVEFDTHKSPFHESDSGVSDIASVSGASPQREADIIMLDDLVDSKNFRPFGLSDERVHDDDQDLIAYLNQDGIGSEADIQKFLNSPPCFKENGGPEVNAADGQRQVHSKSVGALTKPVTRRQRAAAQKQVSYGQLGKGGFVETNQASALAFPSDSEVDIEDDEDFCLKPSKKAKGSVRINKPGASIVKPNIHCVTADTKLTGSGGPSVKVLQVVHTSSGENVPDVLKALEDRNRKNAEQAKLNRQKKKAYIQSLEQQVQDSQVHIDALQKRLQEEKTEKESLKEEVEYLKAVLANQSALAGLLKSIPTAKGVNLSSSFVARKRSAEMDHSYTPNKKQCTRPLSSAGVCLHVDSDNVSLEFCHHCARKAQGVLASGSS